MALEVEHKFLVEGDGWKRHADDGVTMRQGYLASGNNVSIRVRVAGEQAWLNIKHARKLTVRQEFEYPIPLTDAEALLASACQGPLVEKTRYRITHGRHVWEVDVFHGDNAGLVLAEIELSHEGESFERPPWVGRDVSEEARYLNQNLARNPYCDWREGDPA